MWGVSAAFAPYRVRPFEFAPTLYRVRPHTFRVRPHQVEFVPGLTFIDWVAPTGAVFVYDRTERLQGRSTIGLLVISRPVKF